MIARAEKVSERFLVLAKVAVLELYKGGNEVEDEDGSKEFEIISMKDDDKISS
jgi:hypothetical protein